MKDLIKDLENNSYPGRGIVLGRSGDGKKAVIAYFIMGRSVNSRNRVFVEDGDGIRTKAYDPAKLSDPSLVIYAPVRVAGMINVVTNGDQTDTVMDHLGGGEDFDFGEAVTAFETALRERTFEPDEPNFTPRISGITVLDGGRYSYALSILKSADGDPASARRFFYEYESPRAGEGHFIHTYAGDGDPLPSYYGEPDSVDLSGLTGNGDIDAFTDSLWRALNADNKVSLFTRFIDIETGKSVSRIKNVNA